MLRCKQQDKPAKHTFIHVVIYTSRQNYSVSINTPSVQLTLAVTLTAGVDVNGGVFCVCFVCLSVCLYIKLKKKKKKLKKKRVSNNTLRLLINVYLIN